MVASILPGLPGAGRSSEQPISATEKDGWFNAGQSPLRKDERGIILSSPISVVPYSNIGEDIQRYQYQQSARPDDDELIRSLLLWDYIQLPEEEAQFYRYDKRVDELLKEGIARPFGKQVANPYGEAAGSTDLIHFPKDNVEAMTKRRLRMFEALNQASPGCWAMARGPQSPLIPAKDLNTGQGLRITLQNILPIPSGDVRINEILEFREKRRPELIELRTHLSDLMTKLSSDSIDAMSKNDILQKFASDIDGYKKSLSESKFKSFLIDLIASSNTAAGVIAVGGALIAGSAFISVAGAGIGAAVTFEAFSALKKSKTKDPYEYVARYHKEIPWAL